MDQSVPSVSECRTNPVDPSTFDGIRLLALDFDGVITNNKVYTSEDGTETVRSDRSDSLGIGMLKDTDVDAIVISREINKVVEVRCKKIGIPVVHGVLNKIEILMALCDDRGIQRHEVAFMGNDSNDVECMNWAGVSIAPSDAHNSALNAASIVTNNSGGDGAVREITDLLVESHKSRAGKKS